MLYKLSVYNELYYMRYNYVYKETTLGSAHPSYD